MKINDAKFVKGIVNPEDLLQEHLPQIAFIGRSNVGKSSLINILTKQKDLAKTSSFPGHTRQINLFLINNKFYLVDLPGYGYARLSSGGRDKIYELINGYLFGEGQKQRIVVLIIDALVGLTKDDVETLRALEEEKKNIVIVLNKIDKLKKSVTQKRIQELETQLSGHVTIPFSTKTTLGLGELLNAINASIS
jgi:GTP-binding protein